MEHRLQTRRFPKASAGRVVCHQAGFSLLEMLGAMSLFMLVMGLLLTMVTQFLKDWHHHERQQEAGAHSRLLLQYLSDDLKSMTLLPKTNSLFIDIPIEGTSLQKNIFFLTSSYSSSLGESRAVGYFLTPSLEVPDTFCCYRFIATAEETRKACLEGTLLHLVATASPRNTQHCSLIVSKIHEWHITPAWASAGHFLLHPLATTQAASPPNLIEVSVTTGDKKLREAATFSTAIALPPK